MSSYEEELISVLRYRATDEEASFNEDEDGSLSMRLQVGDWLAHSNVYMSEDGRRSFGRLVLSSGGVPRWYAGFAGEVLANADAGRVADFLREATEDPEPEFPIRGPWDLKLGEKQYALRKTSAQASLDLFVATEEVMFHNVRVYQGIIHGGNINP